MAAGSPAPSNLILGPALLTLGVTVLRFVGELSHWSPRLFSREAGGAAALVGIVWLVPLFGAYFGLRLARAGARPAHHGRALGVAVLALVLNPLVLAVLFTTLVKSPVPQIGVLTVTSWAAILLARSSWPELWRVLLTYAFAARVPVLVAMAVSIFGGLDTHYAKPRPDFPPAGPGALFFWTALLPQLGVWIWFTVAVGLVSGITAAALVAFRERRAARAQPA